VRQRVLCDVIGCSWTARSRGRWILITHQSMRWLLEDRAPGVCRKLIPERGQPSTQLHAAISVFAKKMITGKCCHGFVVPMPRGLPQIVEISRDIPPDVAGR